MNLVAAVRIELTPSCSQSRRASICAKRLNKHQYQDNGPKQYRDNNVLHSFKF